MTDVRRLKRNKINRGSGERKKEKKEGSKREEKSRDQGLKS